MSDEPEPLASLIKLHQLAIPKGMEPTFASHPGKFRAAYARQTALILWFDRRIFRGGNGRFPPVRLTGTTKAEGKPAMGVTRKNKKALDQIESFFCICPERERRDSLTHVYNFSFFAKPHCSKTLSQLIYLPQPCYLTDNRTD